LAERLAKKLDLVFTDGWFFDPNPTFALLFVPRACPPFAPHFIEWVLAGEVLREASLLFRPDLSREPPDFPWEANKKSPQGKSDGSKPRKRKPNA
jgi:hypothetical protein